MLATIGAFNSFQAIKTSIRREDLDLFCLVAEEVGQLALFLFVPSSSPNIYVLCFRVLSVFNVRPITSRIGLKVLEAQNC